MAKMQVSDSNHTKLVTILFPKLTLPWHSPGMKQVCGTKDDSPNWQMLLNFQFALVSNVDARGHVTFYLQRNLLKLTIKRFPITHVTVRDTHANYICDNCYICLASDNSVTCLLSHPKRWQNWLGKYSVSGVDYTVRFGRLFHVRQTVCRRGMPTNVACLSVRRFVRPRTSEAKDCSQNANLPRPLMDSGMLEKS
jgi:hypothetical protein